LALGKKIIIVKNATAYAWYWYCHLVVDRASLKGENFNCQWVFFNLQTIGENSKPIFLKVFLQIVTARKALSLPLVWSHIRSFYRLESKQMSVANIHKECLSRANLTGLSFASMAGAYLKVPTWVEHHS
jgi:hypothetical protein